MKKRFLQTMIFAIAISLLCGVGLAEKCKKEKTSLPVIVKAIVDALFPSAEIQKVEAEEESIKVIEVDLKQSGKECSVNVTEDGTVLSIEKEVSAKSLPPAVAAAIKKAVGKGKVKIIEKEEIRAVVKVVKLPKPVTGYEAKFIKDGKLYEVKVASSGKVLSVEAEEGDEDEGKGHDEDADHDDDDDEDSEEVSIKQVPKRVRATILKESKGGKIEEIEREKEDGKVIFEVEVLIDGKEIELKIAPNGKLLSKEEDVDDHDDDED
jgi:hypothetical protein